MVGYMLISKNKVIQNASKTLEEDLKTKLPADYSNFLDKYNGGSTYKSKVKVVRKWDDGYGYKVEKLRPVWKEQIEYLRNLVQEEVILKII